MRILVPAVAGLALVAASPLAAQNQSGLVNVNISDVAVDLSDLLDVNVQDLLDLGSVQVPIGIAANVCPNVGANVLAQAAQDGTAECTANSTSNALAHVVQRSLNGNTQ